MSGSTSPRKVLVVDDDPVIGKSFSRVLSGKGYAVITAANGEEALQKLSAEAYDVVFADIRMPGMSGIDVAKQLKETQPWLPVVIITGYGSKENELRAEAAGVSGFMRKPLSPEMIESAAEATFAAAKAETAPVVEVAIESPVLEAVSDRVESKVKDIALFFAAPFVGLAYLLALPLVGLGLLAWIATKAIVEAKPSIAKTVTLLFATPFIGLAFIVVGPIVGCALLLWFSAKALVKFVANIFSGKSES